MSRFSRRTWRKILYTIAIVLLLLGSWVGWKTWLKPWLFPPSPLVRTPSIGLEQLTAKSLYYSGPAALEGLQVYRPDLLSESERAGIDPRILAFGQATQAPAIFANLDSKYRFDTVLLLDDPSRFTRLLNYLIEPPADKRTFKLVYLDHWMMVFKRNAPREWQIGDIEPLKQRMKSLRSEDRAAFLAKAAERMMAVGYTQHAKQWLEEALDANSSSLEALAGLASLHSINAEWEQVAAYADKALEEDPNYGPALQQRFAAEIGKNRPLDAFKTSAKLLQIYPDTPALLRQHASTAHLINNYRAEIIALSRLIVLTENTGLFIGEYEFALGEAHALEAKNDAVHVPRAVDHFKKALQDPNLPPEMRTYAEKMLRNIQEKTGFR